MIKWGHGFWGTRLLRVMTLALTTCMLALGGLASPAHAAQANYDGDPKTLTGADWMSGISGERLLSDIDIPGTHNSALSQAYLNGQTTARKDTVNYVISQSKLIPAQLDDGVRLLDLSLTARKPSTGWSGADDHLWVAQTVSAFGTNNLTYYAQDARGNAISFKRAVNYARAFLRKHPSETVIVYLRADGTDVQNVFSLLRQEIDEYASYLYLENDMPRLKDVRGKVVICSDHSELLAARCHVRPHWQGVSPGEYRRVRRAPLMRRTLRLALSPG